MPEKKDEGRAFRTDVPRSTRIWALSYKCPICGQARSHPRHKFAKPPCAEIIRERAIDNMVAAVERRLNKEKK